MFTSHTVSQVTTDKVVQNFFDLSLDMFMVIGADGYIKKVIPPFCRFLGYTEEELLAEPLAHFLHPDDRDMTATEMKRLLEGGSSCEFKNRYRHKAGHYLAIAWTAEAKEGVIYGIGHDITALTLEHEEKVETLTQEHAQETLEHEEHVETLTQEHAQESLIKDRYAQRQADFTAELSHELRNPLNAIRGGMDVLDDGLSILQPFLVQDERATETFSLIKETVNNLRSCTEQQKFILDSFLDFSKLEAGKLVLSKNVFDAAKVCNDAVNMMQYIAHQKKLALTVDIPETACLVKGDAFRLKQIILNLLGNAIKFTQEGSVAFRLIEEQNTETHTYFKIIVSDTGIGMDKHEQQRLFQSYSQANTSIAQQYGGTGLGLFITKSLVDMMKGRIEVNSEKGKGSEFACLIRCKRLSEEEEKQYLEQQPVTPSTPITPRPIPMTLTVLIVDDNVINQKVLGRMLEHQQHICHLANNGLEALKQIFPTDQYSNNPFDIIFMDTKMPVMDGLAATKAIRKLEREYQLIPVPIIGISGGSQALDKELALKAGMNDYLVKPIQKEEVYRLIERHTRKIKQPYVGRLGSTVGHVVLDDIKTERQFKL